MADVEEVEETIDDVAGEVEERARIDENVYYDDSKVLEAISGLAEKLDGLRDMVSAFVDAGGVISEGEPVSLEVDEPLYDDDIPVEIDEDVIRDIANVEFND